MFNNVNTSGAEASGDYIGRQVLPTGIYEAKVKVAYGIKSNRSQAQAVVLILLAGGQEIRETIWVTSGKGDAFYEKDGKKKYLPGWEMMNDLAMLTTEVPLEKQPSEDKVVRIWNNDKKAEENASMPCLVELQGKEVLVAIFDEKQDKTKDDGNGNYKPTGETFKTNTIQKFMHPTTKGTLHEHLKGIEPGTYHKAFEEKFSGKEQDKTDKSGSTPKSGMPGQPPAPGGGQQAAETSSLFDRNK